MARASRDLRRCRKCRRIRNVDDLERRGRHYYCCTDATGCGLHHDKLKVARLIP